MYGTTHKRGSTMGTVRGSDASSGDPVGALHEMQRGMGPAVPKAPQSAIDWKLTGTRPRYHRRSKKTTCASDGCENPVCGYNTHCFACQNEAREKNFKRMQAAAVRLEARDMRDDTAGALAEAM